MWLRIAVAIIAIIFACEISEAQTAADIAKFAKNGKSLTQAELKVFRLHQASALMRKYDKNRNGRIDAAEAEQIVADAEQAITEGQSGAQDDEIVELARGRAAVPVEELATLSPLVADEKKDTAQQRLFIRRNKLDLGLPGFAKNPVPRSDAEGARVSYSRDGLTNETVWTLDGVASFVLAANADWEGQVYTRGVPMLTAYAIVPWIDVRRRTSSNPKAKQTDVTTIGIDSTFEIYGGPLGGVSYLTLAPSIQTDRQSDATIYNFTAKWQASGILGMGRWYNITPGLQFTWRGGFEAIYQNVEKPGSFQLPGSEFAWTGAWAQGKLRYMYNADYIFTLTTTVSEHYDWVNHRSAGLLSANLAYQIDPNGITSVSIEYRRGREWSTWSSFDLLTAGLNFKL
jgi:hypothetical protein